MTEPIATLRCPHCSHQQVLGFSEKLVRLRGRGQLRREKNPTPELVDALFEAAFPSIPCRQCGETGLVLERLEDEESPEFWGERRRCRGCQQPIAAERLEIFPNAERCASCEQTAVAGGGDERDYCPRCGDLLTLVSSSAGVTRFRSRCTGCGYSSS